MPVAFEKRQRLGRSCVHSLRESLRKDGAAMGAVVVQESQRLAHGLGYMPLHGVRRSLRTTPTGGCE